MDIAELIVDRAVAIQQAEERSKSIDFDFSFHIHATSGNEQCFNISRKFTLYLNKNKVVFAFKHAKWTQNKDSIFIDQLTKLFLRQIIRDVLDTAER